MRLEQIRTGTPLDPALAGAVLSRDLVVGGARWSKGRRLSEEDLAALEHEPAIGRGPWAEHFDGEAAALEVTWLVPDETDVHEDEASMRLAAGLVGMGVTLRGPSESRVDVLAAQDGVLRVDVTGVERLDRIDPISVFRAFDGQVVSAGAVVARVKVGPHLMPEAVLERAEAVLRRRPRAIVDVRSFARRRVAALVVFVALDQLGGRVVSHGVPAQELEAPDG